MEGVHSQISLDILYQVIYHVRQNSVLIVVVDVVVVVDK
jgi:hypothetical protein